MTIDEAELRKYFSVGDIVASGGGRRFFKITKILNDRAQIQPTAAKTASRLRYDKLSVVIDNFDIIDPKDIETTVGDVLKKNNLADTQNESYLYGMAREYLERQELNLLSASFIQLEFEDAVEEAKKRSSAERKARLESAPKKPEKIVVITTAYRRNADIVAEVLEMAKGICGKCGEQAPFKRAKNNTPYLEVHHIVPLANDGDDTLENAIALCPNCHRERHFGITD